MGRERVVLSESQTAKLHLPEGQRFEVGVQADATGDGPVVLPPDSPLYGEYGLYQMRPVLGRHVYSFYTFYTLAQGLYRHRVNIAEEQDAVQAQRQAVEDVRWMLGLWNFLTPEDKTWMEQQREAVVRELAGVKDPTKVEIHGLLSRASWLDISARDNPGKARTQHTAVLNRYQRRNQALSDAFRINLARVRHLRERVSLYNSAVSRLVRLLALAGRLPERQALHEFASPERILRQDKPGNYLVHVIRRLERVRPDALNDPGVARRLEEAIRFEGSLAWFCRPFARLDSYTNARILEECPIILAEVMGRRAFLELETTDAYERLIERLQAATYLTGLKVEAATVQRPASLTAARQAARATLALARYRLDQDNRPTGEWYMTPEYHDQLRLGRNPAPTY